MSKRKNRFSPEVRARAVRMVLEHEEEYSSWWAAIKSISSKMGCSAPTLHDWIKKQDINAGKRVGIPTEVSDRMKALERENKELRQVKRNPSQGDGHLHEVRHEPLENKV